DRHIARDPEQLALHRVVPAAEVELVAKEAVERLASVLVPLPARRLTNVPAARLFDVAAELERAELEERVHEPAVCCALEARLHVARPGAVLLRAGRVHHHLVVARTTAVAAVERLVGRAGLREHGAR